MTLLSCWSSTDIFILSNILSEKNHTLAYLRQVSCISCYLQLKTFFIDIGSESSSQVYSTRGKIIYIRGKVALTLCLSSSVLRIKYKPLSWLICFTSQHSSPSLYSSHTSILSFPPRQHTCPHLAAHLFSVQVVPTIWNAHPLLSACLSSHSLIIWVSDHYFLPEALLIIQSKEYQLPSWHILLSDTVFVDFFSVWDLWVQLSPHV